MKACGLSLLLALVGAVTAEAGHPWPGCSTCGAKRDCCDNQCGHSCHVFGGDKEPPPDTWDGSYWGFCQHRPHGLHLWDDYCQETSPCPCCGHAQGRMFCHTFCKKRCLTEGNGCESNDAVAPAANRKDTSDGGPASGPYYEQKPVARQVKHRKAGK